MRTVAENLREMADEIESQLKELLETHTKITQWNFPHRNAPFVFIGFGDYQFHPLSDAGRQVQSKVYEDFRHFTSIVRVLLKQQPSAVLDDLRGREETVIALIEQTNHTGMRNGQEAFELAQQQISKMTDALKHLYDGSGGSTIFVPDVNALLHNTDIEHWEFPGVPRFTIAFTPTVLQELDLLKVNHRVEGVRTKAETIINRIKEYRRRGRLSEGVPIVGGKIDGMALAVEPDFADSLPWFDKENNDDRILASVIEIMRRFPRSPVAVVTRDINMQNKADFARIEVSEPPDP